MIPIGFIIFAILCGIVIFIFGFLVNIKEEPSFGAWRDGDEKCRLLYHPVTHDCLHGTIELLDGEVLFKDFTGKQDMRISYDTISRCKVYSSRIAMITGGAGYHYLGIYKKDDPYEFLTFSFNVRAYFYAKNICEKINLRCRDYAVSVKASEPQSIENEVLPEYEKFPIEKKKSVWWRIYFFIFIVSRCLALFETTYSLNLLNIFNLVFIAIIIYSWVWGRYIKWFPKISWLIKLWSMLYLVMFAVVPVLLMRYLYTGVTRQEIEPLIWVINIVIQYPAVYVMYKMAWKSRLLYKIPGKQG